MRFSGRWTLAEGRLTGNAHEDDSKMTSGDGAVCCVRAGRPLQLGPCALVLGVPLQSGLGGASIGPLPFSGSLSIHHSSVAASDTVRFGFRFARRAAKNRISRTRTSPSPRQ